MPDSGTITAPTPLTTGRTLDHAAAVYDVLSPLMTFGMERRYRRIAIDLLDLDNAMRVLDVGCGTGTLTRQVAQALKPTAQTLVVGIDAAPKMIAVANSKATHLSNVRYDTVASEALPYKDGEFQRAVSTFFFHHVDFDLKVKSLNEMWRVLSPDGVAVIVDVDIPTHWFGKVCAWSGYWLFQQPEIKENIDGLMRDAMDQSHFDQWESISHHSGYITVFKLRK